jgi:excisionase family DNA binding protein
MPDAEPLPHLLTIDELAEHLGVTQRHVRRLVAEKRVPYLKWRRFIRFDPAEIAAWLDRSRQSQRADTERLAGMAARAADPHA